MKLLTFACGLFFALGSAAVAQQTTATVTGIVTDSSGAPIANVRVKATSTQTNAVRETTKEGFQSGKVTGLALQVGITARVGSGAASSSTLDMLAVKVPA